ncbi:MAG: DUF1697 domain-containing protein [Bacteroidales bacterium]|nr:DUF1697 domain-containing protein [Bacteroidales bacterium]
MNKTTKTYFALLRGINVGGKNMLPMVSLKKLFEQIGFTSVTTYLQSGNVVFRSVMTDEKQIEIILKQSIHENFGLLIEVFVKQTNVLTGLIDQNPFNNRVELESDKTGLVFLSGIPSPEGIEKLSTYEVQPDEYFIFRDYVFIYCPNGFGRARITNAVLESKLKLKSTIRNWKTIQALAKISTTV